MSEGNERIKFGVKQEGFSGGAKRNSQEGKGRFDLIPYFGLLRLARRFEDGLLGYPAHNAELGMPLGRFACSCIRHMYQAIAGLTDEDHAGASAWNAMMFLQTQELIERGVLPEELDDLPRFGGSSEEALARLKELVNRSDEKLGLGTCSSDDPDPTFTEVVQECHACGCRVVREVHRGRESELRRDLERHPSCCVCWCCGTTMKLMED